MSNTDVATEATTAKGIGGGAPFEMLRNSRDTCTATSKRMMMGSMRFANSSA